MKWSKSTAAIVAALFFVLQLSTVISQLDFERPCVHEIFCDGSLLHEVQMAEIFPDSKTFVDRPLRYTVEQTLRNFADFMEYHQNTPSPADLKVFVEYNFNEPGTELEKWNTTDWHENPQFLTTVRDIQFREFGKELHEFWHELGRKMKPEVGDDPTKTTLIYVPHPVIVPGGRFREFYYWDSYWIQKGLIQSEMLDTVEGMIRNFLYMVEELGYVPNGGRIYYRRSQPPLLIPMVKNYYNATGKVEFVREVLPTLVKEFSFWETQRAVNVSFAGQIHKMFRYNSEKNGPRPESYMEDYKLAEGFLDEEKILLWSALHSAAESGIDFSSRWFVKDKRLRVSDLIHLSTRSFIPADLNAYLYYNAKALAEFHSITGDSPGAERYEAIATALRVAINTVLWDEGLGCWFDYNFEVEELHREFYPTNLGPLWAGVHTSNAVVERVLDYLETSEALSFPGGIPSSLHDSGEQWDFPNAWAPLVDLIVDGLDKSGNPRAVAKAFELAQTWVATNYMAFYNSNPKHMFEKYNVTELGRAGGGGEYEVVVGFGWTNGVIIDYLARYGDRLVAPSLGFAKPCDHEIFCVGPLLHTVQMAEIFNDSKTFVDRPLRYSIEKTLLNFEEFMQLHNNTPSDEALRLFVEYNFEEPGTEFVDWDPEDWKEAPEFLSTVKDTDFRAFGKELHEFWFELGRKMKPEVGDNPNRTTLIYVPHPVIVPGGRFREFYYWDSYWIQKGLIKSEMLETVEGMIRNFLYMVEELGYVPNGGRIYYTRSQPPLLIPMVKNYIDAAAPNLDFLREVLPTLAKEFNFWETKRAMNVPFGGQTYRMFRYNSEKNGPRPESYMEDYKLAEEFTSTDSKVELWSALHSGAESGIDFSSRWFVKEDMRRRSGELKYLSTRSFIPADLNAYLYYNAKTLAEFYHMIDDGISAAYYENVANDLRVAINAVLWDETLGCWFDYNHRTGQLHKEFYPTNLGPLWAGAQTSDAVVGRVLEYLQTTGALAFPGGIPSSLSDSGEQWDMPNAWAPLVDLIVDGLERSENPAAVAKAFEIAQTWVSTNYLAFYNSDPKHMFEKYNVTQLGLPGGGGEYEVVVGFGWTNGVIIDFLARYGDRLEAPPLERGSTGGASTHSSVSAVFIVLLVTLLQL